MPKAVKGEIILVLGGTRSGKSEFAEAYALHKSALAAYVATAEITDAEMARRVKIHQGRRKKNWLIRKNDSHRFSRQILPLQDYLNYIQVVL